MRGTNKTTEPAQQGSACTAQERVRTSEWPKPRVLFATRGAGEHSASKVYAEMAWIGLSSLRRTARTGVVRHAAYNVSAYRARKPVSHSGDAAAPARRGTAAGAEQSAAQSRMEDMTGAKYGSGSAGRLHALRCRSPGGGGRAGTESSRLDSGRARRRSQPVCAVVRLLAARRGEAGRTWLPTAQNDRVGSSRSQRPATTKPEVGQRPSVPVPMQMWEGGSSPGQIVQGELCLNAHVAGWVRPCLDP